MTGCQSIDSHPTDLNSYLQQFVGQSRLDIQNHLDFKSLGYKVSEKVQFSDNELSYTILRPLNIPLAGSNATIGSNAMGIPVIRYDTTSTQSYDIHFNCKITFKLKDDIAQSIQYSGKAC